MSNRPNVLLISTDHWPASLFGVAGHPLIQTPTLDQLARNGVRFTNCYSECPICIPARRTLMTGVMPSTHGDRTFKTDELMPQLPTLAQTFRNAGYQAYAVGKLHVYPQRDRIGFDDVIIAEEGRPQLGAIDDYQIYLAEQGFAGQEYMHGMSNNDYQNRPWHLPESAHVTNWATREMARMIRRRDPTRPGFWFLSYCHPHPPLVPLRDYLEMYDLAEIDLPFHGDWSNQPEALPYVLQSVEDNWNRFSEREQRQIRRAFYAQCTHIDHQLRVVIGTLREEMILDNTIIMFTSDHGDMLGNHGLWAKRLFYENSANIPMILVGTGKGETGFDPRVGHHRVDDRLVGWQDVMPTLLDLAGIAIPESVEGMSMVGDTKRETFYGECAEDAGATRMIRDQRYKLIYYAAGNVIQLFDLQEDPQELHDLAGKPERVVVEERLKQEMINRFYGSDLAWIKDGQLVGMPTPTFSEKPKRGLSGQRGLHYPPPPLDQSGRVVGSPV